MIRRPIEFRDIRSCRRRNFTSLTHLLNSIESMQGEMVFDRIESRQEMTII